MNEKTTPCERCKNPECEFAGRMVYVLVCLHEYVAPPQTNGDRLRETSDEGLASWACSVETAGRAFGPKGKAAWLEWFKREAK